MLQKIVVTGATGMIGSALVRCAIKKNIVVLCIVRKDSERLSNIPESDLVGIEYCDADGYAKANLDGSYDVFYHLAWEKTHGLTRDDTAAQNNNIQYTLDAVQLAKRLGCVKFVGAGSQAEYGIVNEPLKPETPVNPESGYGIAKYAAGRLSGLLCSQLGLEFNWIRFLSIFGPLDGEHTLIMYTISELMSGRSPEFTKCEQVWDYLYSGDAAEALLAIGKNGVNGKSYPLGLGIRRRLSDYIESIRDIINPSVELQFGKKEYYPHQSMYLCADISDLTKDTGWTPRISFEEGINAIIESQKKRRSRKPLLSICIPTYNRAEYLGRSIASLVSQREFHGEDVELVISDNASTDNTEEVVARYQKLYDNIIYSKNEENIRDKNFPIVISKAHGLYRKLCNDTIIYGDNCLKSMLEVIAENIEDKPVIYYLVRMNPQKTRDSYRITGLDAFVKAISTWGAWIGSFGIWEEDFEVLDDKFEGCNLNLWQMKVMLEVASKKACYIENRKLFENHGVSQKNSVRDMSYGIFKVFHNNYLCLFQPYLDKKVLLKSTYESQKKLLLFDIFLGWLQIFYFHRSTHKISPDENIERLIFRSYWKKKYYVKFLYKLKFSTKFRKAKHIPKFIKRVIKFFLPYGIVKLRKHKK